MLTSDAPTLKHCARCGRTKPLAEFYLRGAGRKPGERQARCRSCMKLAMRESRARHREAHGFGQIERFRLKRPVSYAASCIKTATTLLLRGDVRRARWYADRAAAAIHYAKQTGSV